MEVPPEAEVRCTGAALPTKRGEAVAWAFGYAQTERLGVCEERRALGVEAMRLHNQRMLTLSKEVAPRPWWKFWAGN